MSSTIFDAREFNASQVGIDSRINKMSAELLPVIRVSVLCEPTMRCSPIFCKDAKCNFKINLIILKGHSQETESYKRMQLAR